MKLQLLLLWFSLCIAQSLTAQASLKKNFPTKKGQELTFELKHASEIKVEAWNKNEVALEAKVILSGENTTRGFEIEIKSTSTGYTVYSELDYSTMPSVELDKNQDIPQGLQNVNINIRDGKMYAYNAVINYTIKVPAQNHLRIDTKGDVEVKGVKNDINVSTCQGFVDVDFETNTGAQVYLATHQGEVYSDFDINTDSWEKDNKKGNHHGCSAKQSLETKINGGGTRKISIETNCGDIFLRKRKGGKRI